MSLGISQERLAEIAAPYGGVDALNAKMRQFQQAVKRLAQDYPELIARYPDTWVAVGPDGLLATASNHEELLAEVRAKHPDLEFTAKFLDTDPTPLILRRRWVGRRRPGHSRKPPQNAL